MQRYAMPKSTDGGAKYRTTLYLERGLVQRVKDTYPSVSHLINDMLRAFVEHAGVAKSCLPHH